jgi:histidinol-phosphate aminotransferase
MRKLVRDSIENLPLYPPGKSLEEVRREYGIEDVIKLASNENCLGASPKAIQAIKESIEDIHRYPDNDCHDLKEKLGRRHGVLPEQIILGHGSNELVQFILLTFLLSGEEVITGRPTFLLYGMMGRALAGKVTEIPLKAFAYDLQSIAEHIKQETKIIFISNPNNPTGTIVTERSFARFMEHVPEDVLVVVDEAYGEYVTNSEFPETLNYLKDGRNIIILKTFSKAYGLAGLRIGYGMSQTELIGHMEKVREPFNFNYLA